MAVIKSGASSDQLTIDATAKAARTTQYDQAGRDISLQSKSTYYAAGTFTPAATPTDLVTIFGSASKTVRVLSMKIGTTNTAAGSQQFFLVKRSSANSAGTFVAATAVQADTADAAATATSYGHYTANPGSLGTSDGNVNVIRVASPAAVPASFAGVREVSQLEMLPDVVESNLYKPIVLNGTAQGLAINFNGAALVAGQTHTYTIVWTEEE